MSELPVEQCTLFIIQRIMNEDAFTVEEMQAKIERIKWYSEKTFPPYIRWSAHKFGMSAEQSGVDPEYAARRMAGYALESRDAS